MRKLATRIFVVLIICGITPGLAETAENLWHVVSAGHLAHAAEAGADHAPDGDEHGCSGTFHLCSCHVTVASQAAVRQPRVGQLLPAGEFRTHGLELTPDPHLSRVFHPPRS